MDFETSKLEFWILTSTEDNASQTIRSFLIKNYPFELANDPQDKWSIWEAEPTYLLNLQKTSIFNDLSSYFSYVNVRIVICHKRMIFLDDQLSEKDLEQLFGGHFIICASRHRSQTALPAILTHATGNWNHDNSHGGSPNSISTSSALMLGFAYRNLVKQQIECNLEWPVDLEVNHHGPTEISRPLIFMELGSSDENDTNETGASAVGKAILYTLKDFIQELFISCKIYDFLKHNSISSYQDFYSLIKNKLKETPYQFGLGFGGPHYARNFSKLYQTNRQLFISHIAPKYSIPDLTKEHIQKMIDKTLEPINTFIIDWKSMKSDERNHLLQLLAQFDIKIMKTKDI